MARRVCRAKNGKFKKCRGGKRGSKVSKPRCRWGRVKSGRRKGLCRKRRPRR